MDHNMIRIHFANRLKEFRAVRGLTQQQLADQAGVALRTVSGLEQNLYEPVWSTALALAGALGVPVQDFAPDNLGEENLSAPDPVKRGRGRPRKLTTEATPPAPKQKGKRNQSENR